MDWADFDSDNQATTMLAPISDHGYSTLLVWLTVDRSTLKNHRTLYEHRVLVRLAEQVPAGIKVCIVADRGFGDQRLYKMLVEELYFDYVIRFRGYECLGRLYLALNLRWTWSRQAFALQERIDAELWQSNTKPMDGGGIQGAT